MLSISVLLKRNILCSNNPASLQFNYAAYFLVFIFNCYLLILSILEPPKGPYLAIQICTIISCNFIKWIFVQASFPNSIFTGKKKHSSEFAFYGISHVGLLVETSRVKCNFCLSHTSQVKCEMRYTHWKTSDQGTEDAKYSYITFSLFFLWKLALQLENLQHSFAPLYASL